jgi:hypothetical protein
MSRCAVVQKSDNQVVNIISATIEDIPPEGTYLIELAEDQFMDIGWYYNKETNSFNN